MDGKADVWPRIPLRPKVAIFGETGVADLVGDPTGLSIVCGSVDYKTVATEVTCKVRLYAMGIK